MARKKVIETEKVESDNGTLKQEQIFTLDNDFVQQKNDSINVDDAFAEFQNKTSSFTPETPDEIPVESELTEPSLADKIKLKMFVGFMCFLLAGLNTFLLNKMRKTNVPFDKMQLTDEEVDSVLPYMESPEIMEFINKIPTWLMAVVHLEYMFLAKHNEYKDTYQIIKVKSKKEETEPDLKTI